MADDEQLEGGDPACWLDRVCPDCGSFMDDDRRHRCQAQDVTSAGGEGERL